MKPSRILVVLEAVELFLYRRASLIISVTQAFRQNLIERGIDGGKIAVVTNGVDLSRFGPMEKDVGLLEQLELRGKFVAGYIGTHGMAHALETLLEAASLLAEDPATRDVRIMLLGDGASRAALIERAREMGVGNVLFLESVSKDQVPRYWSIMDVSIVHLRRTALFKTVIPSKIFESMGMGKPILLGVEGESAAILDSCRAGVRFQPEAHHELAEQIRRLNVNAGELEQLSRNCLAAAHAFDRTSLGLRMLELLRSCVRRGVPPPPSEGR